MDIVVISIFPKMFEAITDYGVIGRALQQQDLKLTVLDLREFSSDKHRTVDDRPYGGGPGMLMMAEPLAKAIRFAKQQVGESSKVIYLSPQGQVFNHQAGLNLSRETSLIFIAGRYEGIDQRIVEQYVDEEWSIGDYVVSGGELPAMVMIDAVCRHLPDTLGNEASAVEDSFADGLLDCPHFTRPEEFEGVVVPSELLSGNHAAIRTWRLKQQLGITQMRRPDLLAERDLTQEESFLLKEFITEIDSRTSSDDDS
mgnify:CR=1 FL=1